MYRQTTTEQSQILFEQREFNRGAVNHMDIEDQGGETESGEDYNAEDQEDEFDAALESRRLTDQSPLGSPTTAILEKNSGGTMIKLQKPSDDGADYLGRIMASSSEMEGVHSKIESMSGLTAINKQTSGRDSIVVHSQHVDGNT